MDSVAMGLDSRIPLADIMKRLAVTLNFQFTDAEHLVVEDDTSRVYVSYLCDHELEIDKLDPRKAWLLLEYSGGLNLVKQVLLLLGDSADITIDADFGVALPGTEFLDRIRSEPDWDWRKWN